MATYSRPPFLTVEERIADMSQIPSHSQSIVSSYYQEALMLSCLYVRVQTPHAEIYSCDFCLPTRGICLQCYCDWTTYSGSESMAYIEYFSLMRFLFLCSALDGRRLAWSYYVVCVGWPNVLSEYVSPVSDYKASIRKHLQQPRAPIHLLISCPPPPHTRVLSCSSSLVASYPLESLFSPSFLLSFPLCLSFSIPRIRILYVYDLGNIAKGWKQQQQAHGGWGSQEKKLWSI